MLQDASKKGKDGQRDSLLEGSKQKEADSSHHEEVSRTQHSTEASRNGSVLNVGQAGSGGALLASSFGKASSHSGDRGHAERASSSGANPTSEPQSEQGKDEYEFTGGETQLMRICMDAMHTAGLALIVQGTSTGLLGTW